MGYYRRWRYNNSSEVGGYESEFFVYVWLFLRKYTKKGSVIKSSVV